MPYIDASARTRLVHDVPRTEGELNYVVTRECIAYLERQGSALTYASLNAVIGALECAKIELYRRVAAPYEDFKRNLNGDVYA